MLSLEDVNASIERFWSARGLLCSNSSAHFEAPALEAAILSSSIDTQSSFPRLTVPVLGVQDEAVVDLQASIVSGVNAVLSKFFAVILEYESKPKYYLQFL